MNRVAWRIAADTPTYTADDMTGTGAKRSGGRWNEKDEAVVYSSESRALACFETLVHLKAAGLPFNRYLVRIDIPDPIWIAAERFDATHLPVGWDAEPAGKISIDLGTDWLRSRTSCLLLVPSVIVPEEYNILINPGHPDTGQVRATKERRWLYDPRLSS
jgi:RES domain-containing protein